MNDGEFHARLKPVVERSLDSVSLAQARELAQEAARELLPEPVSASALDAALAALPARVVGDLFGVRERRLPELAGAFARSVASGEAAAGGAAAVELLALFRAAPAEGPLGALRGAVEAEFALANAVGFLSQTYDATAGLIGNGLLALARRPPVRRELSDRPERMEPFLAEALRYDSPVQNTRRFLHGPAEVAGTRLPAGAAILLLIAAANRDPAANPAPDAFSIERAARRSFTFGLGAHACPGQALAMTIAGEALRWLLACELDWESVAATSRYRPSGNARVPVFAPAASA